MLSKSLLHNNIGKNSAIALQGSSNSRVLLLFDGGIKRQNGLLGPSDPILAWLYA